MAVSKAFKNYERVKHVDEGLLQVVTGSSSAQTTPSTTYVEVAGTKLTIVPKKTGSAILYTVEVSATTVDSHAIIHYELQTSEDNVTWTARSRRTLSVATTFTNAASFSYWLTGNVAGDARYFRLMMRNYGTSNRAKHGSMTYWNGAGTDTAALTTSYAIEYANRTVTA